MENDAYQDEWDFFDLDGAIFRRPKGNIGGVTHVFQGKTRTWHLYEGTDKTKPSLFGDRTQDPLRDNR